MSANSSESARRPVRRLMVWITPALASRKSQQLREAALQTNPESSPIIAPVYKHGVLHLPAGGTRRALDGNPEHPKI